MVSAGMEGTVAVDDTSIDDVRAFLVTTREEIRTRDEAERARYEAAGEHRARNAQRIARLIVMQVHDKTLAEALVRFGEAYRQDPAPAKSATSAARLWSHAYWLSDTRAHAATALRSGQRSEFLDALARIYVDLIPAASGRANPQS